MKAIACLVTAALALYASSEGVSAQDAKTDDAITTEKLEKVFENIFLVRGQKYHENRSVYEDVERVIPLKKENVDITIVMKERKMYTGKILKTTKSEINGNKFTVNATAIYSDVQDTGLVQINGTVDQKEINEGGTMSIHWDTIRDTNLLKNGEFNETHMTALEIAPVNVWSVPTIKLNAGEVIAKHVTNDDLIKALNDQMESRRRMQEESFSHMGEDVIERKRFQLEYNKLIKA